MTFRHSWSLFAFFFPKTTHLHPLSPIFPWRHFCKARAQSQIVIPVTTHLWGSTRPHGKNSTESFHTEEPQQYQLAKKAYLLHSAHTAHSAPHHIFPNSE